MAQNRASPPEDAQDSGSLVRAFVPTAMRIEHRAANPYVTETTYGKDCVISEAKLMPRFNDEHVTIDAPVVEPFSYYWIEPTTRDGILVPLPKAYAQDGGPLGVQPVYHNQALYLLVNKNNWVLMSGWGAIESLSYNSSQNTTTITTNRYGLFNSGMTDGEVLVSETSSDNGRWTQHPFQNATINSAGKLTLVVNGDLRGRVGCAVCYINRLSVPKSPEIQQIGLARSVPQYINDNTIPKDSLRRIRLDDPAQSQAFAIPLPVSEPVRGGQDSFDMCVGCHAFQSLQPSDTQWWAPSTTPPTEEQTELFYFTERLWYGLLQSAIIDSRPTRFFVGEVGARGHYPRKTGFPSPDDWVNDYLRHNERRLFNHWDIYDHTGKFWWYAPNHPNDNDPVNSYLYGWHPYNGIPYCFKLADLGSELAAMFGVRRRPNSQWFRAVCRVLRQAIASARDATQYEYLDLTNVSAFRIPRLILWGVPEPSLDYFKFGLHNGAQVADAFRSYPRGLYAKWRGDAPAQLPGQAPPNMNYARPFLSTLYYDTFVTNPTGGEFERLPEPRWVHPTGELVAARPIHQTLGGSWSGQTLNAYYAEFRDVWFDLRGFERESVYAFEFAMFYKGADLGWLMYHRVVDGWLGVQWTTQPFAFELWMPNFQMVFDKVHDLVTVDDVDNTMTHDRLSIALPQQKSGLPGARYTYTALIWDGTIASPPATPTTIESQEIFITPELQIKIPAGQMGKRLVVYRSTDSGYSAVYAETITNDSEHIKTIYDTGETYPDPFVLSTEPLPYGRPLSFGLRIHVLTGNELYVSSIGERFGFTTVPTKDEDGFIIKTPEPIVAIDLTEQGIVGYGTKSTYRFETETPSKAVYLPTLQMPIVSVHFAPDVLWHTIAQQGYVLADDRLYGPNNSQLDLVDRWYDRYPPARVTLFATMDNVAFVRVYPRDTDDLVEIYYRSGDGYFYTEIPRAGYRVSDISWVGWVCITWYQPSTQNYIRTIVMGDDERVASCDYMTGYFTLPMGHRLREIEFVVEQPSPNQVTVYFDDPDGILPDPCGPFPIQRSHANLGGLTPRRKLNAIRTRIVVSQNCAWLGETFRFAPGIRW